MYEIEFCYSNGYLDKALYLATFFVKKIGENKVQTITAEKDKELGWTVLVVYEKSDKK